MLGTDIHIAEKRPSPSSTDINCISECFIKSKHEQDRLILIIAEQDNPPNGIWLSLHDTCRYEPLTPSTNTDEYPRLSWLRQRT